MTNDKIKKRIMRRIYVLFVLRKLINARAMKVYTVTGFIYGMLSLVSVGNIVANMPQISDISGLLTFMTYALTHTEFVVQILIFGTLAVSLWLVKDIAQESKMTPNLRGI